MRFASRKFLGFLAALGVMVYLQVRGMDPTNVALISIAYLTGQSYVDGRKRGG